MKESFKRWWNSDIAVLFRRLAILYLVLALARVVFYLYNAEVIGALGADELWRLFKGALLFDSVSIIYLFGLFILLSMLPLRMREHRIYQKIMFWYFVIMGAIMVALNLIDAVYFHYTSIRVTAADLMFAENENTMQLIGRFMLENWYLVLVWGGLVGLMVWLYRFSGRPKTPIRNIWTYTGVNVVMFFCVAVLSIAMVRGGGLGRDIRPITLSNAMSYATTPNKGNMILSNPFCIIRTIGRDRVRVPEYFSEEELAQIYTPYHYPQKSGAEQDVVLRADSVERGGDKEARQSKKNVVIFVLESFSAEHSALLNPDLYPEGGGYTPFLDSLMQQGYYFKRAYAAGRKSIDALPAILSSMPAFKNRFVLTPQSLGEGMQLPKILANEGYQTMFFCGSPRGSMGFDAYATLAGIKEFYDGDTYEETHPDRQDYDGWWGIWDEPFVDYMGSVLSQTSEPFFSTTFTLSSHHPFEVPEKYKSILPEGESVIHRPVSYTDNAIRLFFEKYKGEEWFNNTIFVFSADHVSSERTAPKTETSVGGNHIIAFLYTPDGSLNGNSDATFQQTDIMPTLLGLLGYSEPYFAFGRDFFNEKADRQPMAINYSYAFQIITDSLVLLFDDEQRRTTAVYSVQDTLMENNILQPSDSAQKATERLLKAYTQQYYQHLENKTYLVPLIE